jgi:hypothetical protein
MTDDKFKQQVRTELAAEIASQKTAMLIASKRRKQITCCCPAYRFPHRINGGWCSQETRDEAGAANAAQGERRKLIYRGLVNEL